MSNNVAPQVTMTEATKKRNDDIATHVLLRCQIQAFKAGETIDGMIARLKAETGIVDINEASLNVRRSQTKAKLIGEWKAKRTDLDKQLATAIATHGEASDEANAVREEMRALTKKEGEYLKTFKLARKGRTGDRPGMSIDELMTDIIHDELVEDKAESVDDITVE